MNAEESLLDQMGIQPFDDNDEDFAPPNWGGKRPGSGRPPANLRHLDISNIGLEFNEPVIYTSDVTAEKCSCGRMGWSDYSVTVTAATWHDEPDEQGNHYPVLATVTMGGQPLRHTKDCPLAE